MIDGDITGYVIGGDGANLTEDTTTFLSGGSSLSFDKTATTTIQVLTWKTFPVAVDVQYFIDRGATMNWWTNHADYTDFASNGGVRLHLIYELNAAGSFTVYDSFYGATLSAGWVKHAADLGSPTATAGSPTAAHRRHCIGIILQGVVNTATTTWSNLRWGPVLFDIAGSGSGGQPGLIMLGNSRDRILLPPWDTWFRNPVMNYKVNVAPSAAEIIHNYSFDTITASIQKITSKTTIENLRRFATYARNNTDWSIAYDSRQLVNTTTDVLSGDTAGTPFYLYLTDTSEIEFLFDHVGLSEVHLLVGPNEAHEYDIFTVPGSGYVSSGSHVDSGGLSMAHTYQVGTPVRPAIGSAESGFYPTAALLDNRDPVQLQEKSAGLLVKAREVTS